jgi:hypothetical protein
MARTGSSSDEMRKVSHLGGTAGPDARRRWLATAREERVWSGRFFLSLYIGRRAEEDRARVASGQATPRRERETEKGRRPQIFPGQATRRHAGRQSDSVWLC